jgi:Flp pilus assembly protein TadG
MIRLKRDQSAQAILEIAFILPVLCVMVLGVVDFSRAIYDTQEITNLAGEGAGLASRGSTLQDAANAVFTDSDLNMAKNGCAIVTSVDSPTAGTYQVTGQAYSSTCNYTGGSQVGCMTGQTGCKNNNATVPGPVQTVFTAAPAGYTVYITEVYYNFSSATPIGSFLHNNSLLPAQMSAIAYY